MIIKNHLKYIIIFFGIILTILFLPKISSAATMNAVSCDWADMQAAINQAVGGDTVMVPAGSCAWNSAIVLNKSLFLIGAGTGNTIITGYAFNVANGINNWRISGFEFKDSGSIVTASQIGQSRSSTGNHNYRIDHNKFIGYDHWIQIDGHSAGVIDHNEFFGSSGTGIYILGDDEAAWT